MIKARSRDFLLTICGVLLLLIALVTVSYTLVNTIDTVSDEKKLNDAISNMEVNATSVRINNTGNFIVSSPKYKDLELSNYKVKFKDNNDFVTYSLNICNKGEEDVIFNGTEMDPVNCIINDSLKCDNVVTSVNLLDGSKNVKVGSYLKSKGCYKMVVDSRYNGSKLNDELMLEISKIKVNINVIEK